MADRLALHAQHEDIGLDHSNQREPASRNFSQAPLRRPLLSTRATASSTRPISSTSVPRGGVPSRSAIAVRQTRATPRITTHLGKISFSGSSPTARPESTPLGASCRPGRQTERRGEADIFSLDMSETATSAILDTWNRLAGPPRRAELSSASFSAARFPTPARSLRMFSSSAPAKARVVDARPAPKLRNHLRSLHAVALTNLGELATGLAVTSSLPAERPRHPDRILHRVPEEGPRHDRGEAARPRWRARPEERDVDVEAELRDESGDTVARFTARWRVGPRGAA